jgi:hypothetical protein
MAQREDGRRNVGLMTAGIAFVGTAAASVVALALANGTANAQTSTTTQDQTTTQTGTSTNSTNTQGGSQLQSPAAAPRAGTSGSSHTGSGGS